MIVNITTYYNQDNDYYALVRILRNENNKVKHIKTLKRCIELYCNKYNDDTLKEFLYNFMWFNLKDCSI